MNRIILFVMIGGILASRLERPSKRARGDKPEAKATETRAALTIGITPEGRILERYNEAIVQERYGEGMRLFVGGLAAHDANYTECLPNRIMSIQTQICSSHTLPTRQSLVLSRAPQSVLYSTALNGNRFVLKYSANCFELGFESHLIRRNHSPYLHPAIVESVFSNRAFKFGLAPRVHFFSPPTPLCETQDGNCDFTMSSSVYEKCGKNPNASLRYILMDFVEGTNLFSYKRSFANATVPIHQALLIGENLIEMVEKLHSEAGIIHGDIHGSNIMVTESEYGKSVSLRFVDFGRSTVHGHKSELRTHNRFWTTHNFFSPWEILGYTTAARDDVMNAVQVIARLMFPLEYEDDEVSESKSGGEEILRWKLGTNFFNYPDYDPLSAFPGLNETQKADVRFHLDLIAYLVQDMTDINSVPPYAAIRNALREAREIVQPFA